MPIGERLTCPLIESVAPILPIQSSQEPSQAMTYSNYSRSIELPISTPKEAWRGVGSDFCAAPMFVTPMKLMSRGFYPGIAEAFSLPSDGCAFKDFPFHHHSCSLTNSSALYVISFSR